MQSKKFLKYFLVVVTLVVGKCCMVTINTSRLNKIFISNVGKFLGGNCSWDSEHCWSTWTGKSGLIGYHIARLTSDWLVQNTLNFDWLTQKILTSDWLDLLQDEFLCEDDVHKNCEERVARGGCVGQGKYSLLIRRHNSILISDWLLQVVYFLPSQKQGKKINKYPSSWWNITISWLSG